MNPRLWMTLVFLLSARSSLADVDQNWLTGIVRGIRAEYGIIDQFCLAANIPMHLDPNNLHQYLQNDRWTKDNVKNTLNRGDVYEHNNVVIAKPKTEHVGSVYIGELHAEYRVLTNLDRLIPNAQDNLLLIYSYLSPCDEKCTNVVHPFTIIDTIKDKVIPNWSKVAFVFKKVFDDPKSGSRPTREALIQSLKRLGDSGIGLQNIFRCDYIGGNSQCFSCSSQGSVSEVCVDNNFVPGQGGSSSRIRDRSSSRIRDRSSSRIRDRSSSRDRSSRDRYNTGPKKQRNRNRSSSSRGPRRNRSSTRRSGKRRSRSRTRG